MGAWGHGSFDNDAALDWMSELAEEEVSVRDALVLIVDAPADAYLEADSCSAALAAAELVAAALGSGDDRLGEDELGWLTSNRDSVRNVGAEPARRAVERVFAGSELRELWDETEPDSEWHAHVRELLRRLGTAALNRA